MSRAHVKAGHVDVTALHVGSLGHDLFRQLVKAVVVMERARPRFMKKWHKLLPDGKIWA
jgi:hypothetical protein